MYGFSACTDTRGYCLASAAPSEKLSLSPCTVSTHLYQLFPKLGVTSRAVLTSPPSPPTRASRSAP
ncbi:LuxR C-terminal-related transcriptional regulator [Streptomyces sp. NPDC052494]|uniref:LuxR C-terminal-related transcriptional regulator n=1 Tax=Streptomyces sp. NPDC052494 TaxID=3365692 RepID=UPI0037D52AE5